MSEEKIKVCLGNRNIFVVEPSSKNVELNKIQEISEKFGRITIKSAKSEAYNHFDSTFNSFIDKLNELDLGQRKTDVIVALFADIMNASDDLFHALAENDCKDDGSMSIIRQVRVSARSHREKKIDTIRTEYRRRKQLKKNPLFVEPTEKAIGIKWRTNNMTTAHMPDHTLVQTTFQYIPIKETLLALFSDQTFRGIFFEFNENKNHECKNGMYMDYCCSRRFKSQNISETDIIIQMAIDDVEVCSVAKSKTNIHKLTAVYFQIRNLPQEYQSRLDFIFVVAICETINTKDKNTSINNIFELVAEEFTLLQTTGLQIDTNINLKAVLFNLVSDNLGMNSSLGFVECFIHEFCCRICTMKRRDREKNIHEDPDLLRAGAEYMQTMDYIRSNDADVDLARTKGVKSECALNKIPRFHILKNPNVGVMHDVLEGLIPSFIHGLMNYCTLNKISSLNDICSKISL